MIWFHPQRGSIVTDKPLDPRWLRYRGGPDDGWRQISEVLPQGFLRGDPAKQKYGMGGPIEVYGPIERTCRDCKQELVFSAAEQKHWYETLGFFIDATAVRCPACRKIEQKKRSYGEAVIAAKSAPSSAAHLNVARAALAWREVGGHFSLDKARAHCHLAKKLGAKTEAEQLLQALSRRTK